MPHAVGETAGPSRNFRQGRRAWTSRGGLKHGVAKAAKNRLLGFGPFNDVGPHIDPQGLGFHHGISLGRNPATDPRRSRGCHARVFPNCDERTRTPLAGGKRKSITPRTENRAADHYDKHFCAIAVATKRFRAPSPDLWPFFEAADGLADLHLPFPWHGVPNRLSEETLPRRWNGRRPDMVVARVRARAYSVSGTNPSR